MSENLDPQGPGEGGGTKILGRVCARYLRLSIIIPSGIGEYIPFEANTSKILFKIIDKYSNTYKM